MRNWKAIGSESYHHPTQQSLSVEHRWESMLCFNNHMGFSSLLLLYRGFSTGTSDCDAIVVQGKSASSFSAASATMTIEASNDPDSTKLDVATKGSGGLEAFIGVCILSVGHLDLLLL